MCDVHVFVGEPESQIDHAKILHMLSEFTLTWVVTNRGSATREPSN